MAQMRTRRNSNLTLPLETLCVTPCWHWRGGLIPSLVAQRYVNSRSLSRTRKCWRNSRSLSWS